MNFNGLRLRDIREAFNLSRKELADQIHVTEQSVWQYESNLATPSFQILGNLNRIFGVSTAFFTKKNSISKVVSSTYVAYRSDIKHSVKNTERETVFLSVVDDFINQLLVGVTLSSETIEKLSYEAISMKQQGVPLDDIAHDVRRKLQIDDKNTMLIALIEKAGVFIIERSLNDKVDAYSAWTDQNRPYIILGTNKSGARRLFDVAHEFGHLLLHHNLEFDETDTAATLRLEKEANAFASALLLDKKLFITNFQKYVSDPTDPKQYLNLKKFYNVSIGALEMRANGLGLMETQQSGFFWGRMTKLGYKKNEPLDSEIKLYIPGKIYAILNSFNRTKIRNLYDRTGVGRSFIEQLVARKILTDWSTMQHQPDNIIQMPTIH
ncbi:spr1629 family repressor/antitoxin [Leuconostoc pseudomesenteroides]|uniref:spr1629 family repressor/antitoxin n=1 Tax=Leuconostoc pseudomesenteroides TaxID=33968 RepID=UPI001665678C|nr:XRE family transcriptional regulator [Leuconostoc pseudomesenteroides]